MHSVSCIQLQSLGEIFEAFLLHFGVNITVHMEWHCPCIAIQYYAIEVASSSVRPRCYRGMCMQLHGEQRTNSFLERKRNCDG